MFKKGDEVFVIIKFTNTENSFVVDIRKRILTSPVILPKDNSEPFSWWTTDIDGNSKGSHSCKELFRSKDEALRTILKRQYDSNFFSTK